MPITRRNPSPSMSKLRRLFHDGDNQCENPFVNDGRCGHDDGHCGRECAHRCGHDDGHCGRACAHRCGYANDCRDDRAYLRESVFRFCPHENGANDASVCLHASYAFLSCHEILVTHVISCANQ